MWDFPALFTYTWPIIGVLPQGFIEHSPEDRGVELGGVKEHSCEGGLREALPQHGHDGARNPLLYTQRGVGKWKEI